EAGRHVGAGFALGRIGERRQAAAAGPGRVLGTEPHRSGCPRDRAAPEAVAPIRSERDAVAQALRGLRGVRVGARPVEARDRSVRIVAALAALWRIGRPSLERVAGVVPVAIVVAGARVLVEVAILLAGGVVLARDPAVEAVFGVVARP